MEAESDCYVAYQEVMFIGKTIGRYTAQEDFNYYCHAFKVIRIVEKYYKFLKPEDMNTYLENRDKITNTFHSNEVFRMNGFRPPF